MTGPTSRRLQRRAGPTIHFAGRLTDAEVATALQGARALVLTSVEEFGIAAVEAQAAGRPVIAIRGGGALETVVDSVTGCFWAGGPDELAAAVLRFNDAGVDPAACVANARRFDTESFRRGMMREIRAAQRGDSRPESRGRQPLVSTRLVTRAARDQHR